MARRRGPCSFHRTANTCFLRRDPDKAVVGLSCNPFSTLRGDRGNVPAQQHPEFEMIRQFLKYVRRTKVRGGVIEEVMGFMTPVKPQHFEGEDMCPELPKSWLHFLVGELKAMGYSAVTLSLDNKIWNHVPRERCVEAQGM